MKYSKKLFTLNSAFLFLLLVVVSAFAGKKAWKADSTFVKSQYFSFGGGMYDPDNVNRHLRINGYPEVSDYYLQVGFGKTKSIKRLVFAEDFSFTYYKPRERNNRRSSLGTFSFISNIGVNLLSEKKVRLYPLAGVGVGIYGLRLYRDEVNFGDYVASNPRPVQLFQPTVLLHAGLGFDMAKSFGEGNKTKRVGLRAGYVFDPTKFNEWKNGRTEIIDGPSANLSGIYGKITFGFDKPRWGQGRHDGCPAKGCGSKCGKHSKHK